jgi:Flp pilus assembly protein TadD
VRDEADLAAAAATAFAHARRANPLDVWAAVGEGRALLALGDRPGARDAFNAAVRLEPNCAPAWIELAYLHLAQGEIGAARAALGRAQAIVRDARGRSFVTAYERALASADPAAVARLRAALGEGT